jgi:hypothetical protein
LKNESKEVKTYYPSFEKFTEQNGVKKFVTDKSLIASWISTEESVTIEAGAERHFPFSIDIPADAPPGGHFAIIWWSTTPPASTTPGSTEQVAIQTRAGVLVYLNVKGNLQESAAITTFKTDSKIISNPKTIFRATITNDGNGYIKPEGKIVISSLFGRQRDMLQFNGKGLQILPKSFRDFSIDSWKGSGIYIGPYKAELTVTYGESGKTTSQSIWIWVIPWVLIAEILVGIIVLFFGFKKYNQWIIKRAQSKKA